VNAYVLSAQSEDDLFEIWIYLAQQTNLDFADRIEAHLFDNFDRLARNPGLGHRRQDLTDLPVLFYRAFPYEFLIVYRSAVPLEIVAVLHAKRNIKEILADR
jgi:plasmid stabilization system protein ParE